MCKDWDFYSVVPRLTERTIEWIGEQRGQPEPFFLYVPFNSPHAPIVPSPAFRGRSQAGGYGDFMVQTDDNVGRILQALDQNRFADNTLVIFTSDNGAERYAYDRIRNFDHYSSGPLRGVKRDLWEGGHRVPFLVRWPGVVKAGTVTGELVSQVDLMATLAAVVETALPNGAAPDSYNLLPVWKDGAPSPRCAIVHNTNPDRYAVRHQEWVFIDALTGAVSPVPEWFDAQQHYTKNIHAGELYDLSEDIVQKRNLCAEHPEKVKELQSLLKKIRTNGQVR
jgi:arylsulfatase A